MQTLSSFTSKDLRKFRLFIFDLDGTLYAQDKLRRRMIIHLISRFLIFSIHSIDLKIITSFRRLRENHKGYASPTLESDQYNWCAEELKIPAEKVENRIKRFMLKLPIKYLLRTRYRNIDKVFDALKKQNIAITIYSDFPVREKLEALHLKADGLFCATDKEIQQLKPSANAIDIICKQMNISKEETIMIGDRDDTDGESARLAGISFLKVDVRQARSGQFYTNLLQMIKTNNG
jgi:FMN phosphatase YigB (HAD superfamily)